VFLFFRSFLCDFVDRVLALQPRTIHEITRNQTKSKNTKRGTLLDKQIRAGIQPPGSIKGYDSSARRLNDHRQNYLAFARTLAQSCGHTT
jgi:hypothetical protein